MFIAVLKAKSNHDLRQVLQQNHRHLQQQSSSYYLNDYIYIGIIYSRDLVIYNPNITQLENANNPAEQALMDWCISELADNVNFIIHETQALAIHNGCSITLNEQTITRSYQPLTEIMLIINVTPDSFSDGGKYYSATQSVVARVKQALDDGVTIIDIGAESTRPHADLVEVAEEILRLTPIIDELNLLKKHYTFKISLDSYKPQTVSHFLAHIDIVNDVSNQLPLELIQQITAAGKEYILMHSLTVPADPQVNVGSSCDVSEELINWFSAKLDEYSAAQINLTKIIIDPGIGFNKTAAQSWQLLRKITDLYVLGCRVLVGHSRKRFLNNVSNNTFANRDIETAVVSNHLACKNIDYLRIHEYQELITLNNLNNNLGIR